MKAWAGSGCKRRGELQAHGTISVRRQESLEKQYECISAGRAANLGWHTSYVAALVGWHTSYVAALELPRDVVIGFQEQLSRSLTTASIHLPS
jgi:hypothetical protein